LRVIRPPVAIFLLSSFAWDGKDGAKLGAENNNFCVVGSLISLLTAILGGGGVKEKVVEVGVIFWGVKFCFGTHVGLPASIYLSIILSKYVDFFGVAIGGDGINGAALTFKGDCGGGGLGGEELESVVLSLIS